MRILILFLVLAGACSRSETSEPATQATEPTAEEAAKSAEQAAPEQPQKVPAGAEGQQAADEAASAVDLDAPPTVELLDAGKPPHKALRATFEAGAKQLLRVTSDWTVSTVYGPLIAVESTMPSLVYELETEVKESTAERTRFALRVKKVTVEAGKEVKPPQVKAVKQSVGSIRGAKGTFSVNARGFVETFAIDAPADESLVVHDMVDQIEQALRLSSLPLPEEPVGAGAKWTASQVIDQRTARIRQTSTFELVDVKGERVRAKCQHTAQAPTQRLKMPGSRSGAEFALNQLDFSGEGKGTWRMNQLGPSSASDQTLTVFKMTARQPKREAVVMAVNTELEVKATR